MLWSFTNFLKYGGTAFELYHCWTASCDPFSCGQKALTYLKEAIRYKRRDLLSEGVLLLQYNARPRTAAATGEAIKWVKFELLPHAYISIYG